MLKKILSLSLLLFAASAMAQNVNIPNATFKSVLLGNWLINTNADSQIQVSEAVNYTGTINCSNMGISDVTGIEAFTNVTGIDISHNQVTSLTLNAPNLLSLDCTFNNLATLSVSGCTALAELHLANNSLTTLNISNNAALQSLICSGNLLTTLNIVNNPQLQSLGCGNNSITSLNLAGNLLLESLDCSYNALTMLNIDANTALEILYCGGNQLTTLSLGNNTALSELYCESNQLTTLDLTSCPNFTRLHCPANQLTFIDLQNGNNQNLYTLYYEDNPDLTCIEVDFVPFLPSYGGDVLEIYSLDCNACLVSIPDPEFKALLVATPAINTNNDNQIQCSEAAAYTGSIDCSNSDIQDLTGIEAFTMLTGLNCSDNNISELDLSNNTQLTHLTVNNAWLETLDLGANTQLTYLSCTNAGGLNHLNIQNGNNANLSFLDASNNYSLYCIQVDNEEAVNESWITDDIVVYSEDCLCTVDFADPEFEFALITWHWELNKNEDYEIQCYEAKNYTGLINCEWLDISDMGGIEAFPNITELRCKYTDITSLDLSANTALTKVSCETTALTSLNVDNLQQLEVLNCYDNNLTALNVSTNTALKELYCSNNQLDELDISNLLQLKFLDCSYNNLTVLEMDTNTLLIDVHCAYNQLTSVDVSAQPELTFVNCRNNMLTVLNIQNGNNENLSLSAQNNNDLSCVQVDDPEWSNENWENNMPYWFNSPVTFSLDCGYNNLYVPDDAFLAYLVANTAINTNGNDAIDFDEAAAFTGTIDCSGLGIESLTGIAAFVNITGLDCSDNLLTSLNVSSNTALVTLDCSGNDITEFISGRLSGSSNAQYKVLNLDNNLALQNLDCSDNQITNLDISNNSILTSLDCSNNLLVSLNAANGNNSNFTTFKAFGNPGLECVQVDNTEWSTENWTNIDSTSNFSENCALGIVDTDYRNVNLYPNPAKSILNIETQGNVSISNIAICDVTGKIVSSPPANSNIINIENLQAGYYTVMVYFTDGVVYSHKLIKQ